MLRLRKGRNRPKGSFFSLLGEGLGAPAGRCALPGGVAERISVAGGSLASARRDAKWVEKNAPLPLPLRSNPVEPVGSAMLCGVEDPATGSTTAGGKGGTGGTSSAASGSTAGEGVPDELLALPPLRVLNRPVELDERDRVNLGGRTVEAMRPKMEEEEPAVGGASSAAALVLVVMLRSVWDGSAGKGVREISLCTERQPSLVMAGSFSWSCTRLKAAGRGQSRREAAEKKPCEQRVDVGPESSPGCPRECGSARHRCDTGAFRRHGSLLSARRPPDAPRPGPSPGAAASPDPSPVKRSVRGRLEAEEGAGVSAWVAVALGRGLLLLVDVGGPSGRAGGPADMSRLARPRPSTRASPGALPLPASRRSGIVSRPRAPRCWLLSLALLSAPVVSTIVRLGPALLANVAPSRDMQNPGRSGGEDLAER